jgi:hypothetical protein
MLDQPGEWQSFRGLFFNYSPLVRVMHHPEHLAELQTMIKQVLTDSEKKNDGKTSA